MRALVPALGRHERPHARVVQRAAYWWKPDPGSAELELVVRGYSNKSRQLAVCTLLHTKGDDIRCGFRPPKKQPADQTSDTFVDADWRIDTQDGGDLV